MSDNHKKKKRLKKRRFLTKQERQLIERWVSQMGNYPLDTPYQKMKIAEQIMQLPYKMIGNGLNRMVFDLGNGYVLKVAVSGIGLTSNKKEYTLYHSCHKEIRPFLCPVLEMGEGWIVMKKVKRKAAININNLISLVMLSSTFYRNGILPVDLRLDNVALSTENKMIVIDYGLFIAL
ncbi:hypothetical protein [Peribacillus deserti]|uniref:Protein kinase domain-containing protein n=1 Tax=Peribacillus deserti TaxID=673318 RepID=A0A2N5M4U4_9BACI|nr:hypothetical protein [Peribacillus deserti]PLT29379.1 hypothetical protein CUU66_13205 [Peribacillus deserti]